MCYKYRAKQKWNSLFLSPATHSFVKLLCKLIAKPGSLTKCSIYIKAAQMDPRKRNQFRCDSLRSNYISAFTCGGALMRLQRFWYFENRRLSLFLVYMAKVNYCAKNVCVWPDKWMYISFIISQDNLHCIELHTSIYYLVEMPHIYSYISHLKDVFAEYGGRI